MRELNANALYDWLEDYVTRFGWSREFDLNVPQAAANLAQLRVIVAQRKNLNQPGHISVVTPEHGRFLTEAMWTSCYSTGWTPDRDQLVRASPCRHQTTTDQSNTASVAPRKAALGEPRSQSSGGGVSFVRNRPRHPPVEVCRLKSFFRRASLESTQC